MNQRELGRLEGKWQGRMNSAAANAVRRHSDREEQHEEACEAVERMLLDSPEWEAVAATDISDIAYDVATRAVARVVRV